MKNSTTYKIFGELDEIKKNYETGKSEKIEGLYRSPFRVIKMCEFYSNSLYLKTYPGANGEINYNKDAIGRDKPFYNIVNYRVALAKTATDLDIKDIQIVSDSPKYQVHSMLLNHEAYEWMKEGFSLTLNKMGATRPKYGGYLIKRTEKDGDLKIDVVDWTKVATDLSDILGGPIIEKHTMSPVQLKKMDGAWENINAVLKAHMGLKQKDKSNKIDVYEVLGEFPKYFYSDAIGEEYTDEDKYEFSLQKYFIADLNGKKYCLYADEPGGKITDTYEYLSWEDNSLDLGRGVIEDSEEAQVWTNDSVINENIAMALAGRVGIKTTSKKLGNNILEHDHGKIYELEEGKDINSFNLAPSSLGQYQNQIEKWRAQADNVTSSYNAVTGEQPPSGTPYSQTALLNQVATKPFDYKREEWGIHITKIFDNWVVPYLIKKIRKEHILVSEFSDSELDLIDESFANYNSNNDIVQEVLNDRYPNQAQQAEMIEGYKKNIKKLGKKRFLEVPKDYFSDIECKVTVVTTGEQKNKAVILQSLSTIMQTVIQSFNPQTGEFGVLKDPTLSRIFNEIVELSGAGISPISLGKGATPTAPTKQAPQAPTSPVVPSIPQMSAPLA